MTGSALVVFVGKRLAVLVVLLAIISFGVFSLLYLAPGDTAEALSGGHPVTPDLLAQLREKYHLNDPFLTQYWLWVRAALHGDLGVSTVSGLSVADTIRATAPITIVLGLYAYLLTMVVGVSLGVIAALRRRSPADRGIVVFSVMGVSMPVFVSGIVMLYLFAVRIPIFPAFGAGSGVTDRLVHLTLPAIALAITQTAYILKLTRAAMVDSLDQDYVAFARARGVSARRVTFVYAFRNAMIPVVTAAGIVLGYLLTGAVLIEAVFSLPGIGFLLVQAVQLKDIPLVQGLALLIATIIILVNLVTDLLYFFIDPRIRVSGG